MEGCTCAMRWLHYERRVMRVVECLAGLVQRVSGRGGRGVYKGAAGAASVRGATSRRRRSACTGAERSGQGSMWARGRGLLTKGKARVQGYPAGLQDKVRSFRAHAHVGHRALWGTQRQGRRL